MSTPAALGWDRVTARPSWLRAAVWLLHLSLPLLGLWLLLTRPELDIPWQHHLGHLLLVVGTALASLVVALRVRAEARRRRDARLTLVSLSFLAPAAFLLLHGIATPAVLVPGRTSAFVLAAAFGLVIGAVLAAWSSLELSERHARWVLAREPWLLAALLGSLILWWLAATVLPTELRQPLDAESGSLLGPFALVGVPLYTFALLRYWRIHRRRPAVMLLSLITAFTLLGEAQLVMALADGWNLSWWIWHVLMLAGFGFVAYSVRVQYHREGSKRSLFAGVALEETVRDLREEHRSALTQLVDAMAMADGEDAPAHLEARAARLAERFDLTDAQTRVLLGAAEATFEVEQLRRQLDDLFHLYVSPDVAATLLDDPDRAGLGGNVLEVTVLFADLRGFTAFTEATDPATVVEVLNRYFKRAVPAVLSQGGTVAHFIGDALMAVFNAPRALPDHAFPAARAALDLQLAAAVEAAGHPDWPRFRVGIETGPALVGNIGGEVRSFTVIGDTVNLAARLEAAAEPGQVVVGPTTAARLAGRATLQPMGPLELKGKARPVQAYTLLDVTPRPPNGATPARPSAAVPTPTDGPDLGAQPS